MRESSRVLSLRSYVSEIALRAVCKLKAGSGTSFINTYTQLILVTCSVSLRQLDGITSEIIRRGHRSE